MDEATRRKVRDRAGNRCEYCRLKQQHLRLWKHQIEHVIPKKHHGSDDADNLALACVRCNLAKSSNLAGRDEETGDIVPLFNPRLHEWQEHFGYAGARIAGRTAIGRVSVDVLNMNEVERLRLRQALLSNGELD
ncbi:MAG TPA: HNH endonuclease [Pirellulales bacterium]|jgi:hypothetical protein|nr:HNH endonuclease [Pirellulales bacterium]